MISSDVLIAVCVCVCILQDQVDSAPYFTEVFRKFTEWLEERKLGSTQIFSIVTDW